MDYYMTKAKIIFMKISASLLLLPFFFGLCSSDLKKNVEKKSVALENPLVVVQLFTSQGCSSCPSADALLEKIKKEYSTQNVYALSYHVDYWDRLGWKDPFSKKQYSDFQYGYAAAFGEKGVYTPQAVVNGKQYFVGSNEAKMDSNISKFLKIPSENSVFLTNIVAEGSELKFDYTVKGNVVDKNLKVALIIKERTTIIKRGENNGLNLLNGNIVAEQIEIPLYKTEGMATLQIPGFINSKDNLSLIGFVQTYDMAITGATQKRF